MSDSMSRQPRGRGILSQSSFMVFTASQGVSAVGDQIYFIALAWTALVLTKSSIYLGMLLMTTALPRAILMLAGGVVVDRWGPRRVILGSDSSRGVVVVALALLLFAGHGSIEALFVVAAIFGVFDAFFYPATTAIIPSLVTPEQLSAANGAWQVAVEGSIVLGPPAGGLLVGFAGPGLAFAVDAASFAVAFAALLAIRRGARRPYSSTQDRPEITGGFRRELVAGVAVVLANPFLRALLPVAAILNLAAMGPLNLGMPLLASLHHWGAEGYGLLEGGLGVGLILGGVAMGAGLRLPRVGVSVMVLVCVQALLLGVLGSSPWLPLSVVVCALSGILLSAINVSIISIIQVVSPRELLGRVSSVLMFAGVGLTPVSYALSGAVVHAVGVAHLLVIGAALEILVAVAALTSPSIRAESAPVTSSTS